MLYDPRKSNISKIQRESGVTFEHISAPQPADIAKAAGEKAAEMITQVSDRYACFFFKLSDGSFWFIASRHNILLKFSVIPAFESAAEELLNNSGLSAVALLSKALAKAAVSLSLSIIIYIFVIFFFHNLIVG